MINLNLSFVYAYFGCINMEKKSIVGIFILIGLILTNVPLESASADSRGYYPFQPTDEVIIEALNFLKSR